MCVFYTALRRSTPSAARHPPPLDILRRSTPFCHSLRPSQLTPKQTTRIMNDILSVDLQKLAAECAELHREVHSLAHRMHVMTEEQKDPENIKSTETVRASMTTMSQNYNVLQRVLHKKMAKMSRGCVDGIVVSLFKEQLLGMEYSSSSSSLSSSPFSTVAASSLSLSSLPLDTLGGGLTG